MFPVLDKLLIDDLLPADKTQIIFASRSFDAQQQRLRDSLNPQQEELLDMLLEAELDVHAAIEYDYRIAGLRFGARLALELFY